MNTVIVGRISEISEQKRTVMVETQLRRARQWLAVEAVSNPSVTREIHMPPELWATVLTAAASPGSMLIITGHTERDHLAQVDWMVATRITVVIHDQLQYPSARRRLLNELGSQTKHSRV